MNRLTLKNNRDVDNFMKDVNVILNPNQIEQIQEINVHIDIDYDDIVIGVLAFDIFNAPILDNLAEILKGWLKIDEVWLFVEYEVTYCK